MKPRTRMVAVLLIVVLAFALTPSSFAAEGAVFTLMQGTSKRLELYRKLNDQWNTIDKSWLYRDFTSAASGNERIAKIVDQNGVFVVVGMSIGTTTYTATTADGETLTGTVTVISPEQLTSGGGGRGGKASPTSGGDRPGTISNNTLFIIQGATSPSISVSPTGGTWASNDASIATVDSSGKVTGVNVGSTEITYTADGNPVRTFTVYVSTSGYSFEVKYFTGYGVGGKYGQVIPIYSPGVAKDVKFSATGDISVDSDSGLFYKDGNPTNWGQGYGGYYEWLGTIIMTSPSMGTKFVNVRLR